MSTNKTRETLHGERGSLRVSTRSFESVGLLERGQHGERGACGEGGFLLGCGQKKTNERSIDCLFRLKNIRSILD